MKNDAGPCTACERLDIIEAMLDTLAERIDQGKHRPPGRQPQPERGTDHAEQQATLDL